MRMTGQAIVALGVFLLATACGERADPQPEPEPVAPVGVPASDAVPDLVAVPTGVDFWTHPNVAFNSLVLVAGPQGLISYNIEDGAEVSRIPGVDSFGVAVSYIGFGPAAAGLTATFDRTDGAFRFYGIDNGSRLFITLSGGPEIRGALRDFCMGRAIGVVDPTLFAVQKGELHIFNITPNMNGGVAGLSVNGRTTIDIPDDIATCAVDVDGVVILGAETGEIYRFDSEDGLASPFSRAVSGGADSLAVLATAPQANETSVQGFIAAADYETGVVTIVDRQDGQRLGAVTIVPSAEVDGVSSAAAFGASGANLGGLYRNGAVALGVDGDTPAIRLIPANGVANGLDLPPLPPANPRGAAATPESDGPDLIIDPIAPNLEAEDG